MFINDVRHCCLTMHNLTQSEDIEKSITDILRKESHDLSIAEIAEKTGLHRNTVAKYVFALEKAGIIESSRTVGRAKMYTHKQ